MKTISVLGAGNMGSAIAMHFALNGCSVRLYSRTEKTLDEAEKKIGETLGMMSANGYLDQASCDQACQSIYRTTSIEDAVKDAFWVIETVTEDCDIKKEVFACADRYAPEGAYLTSDTSALNIFEFVTTSRPEKVMITHFFNPANVMPLVEMVRGPETSDETVSELKAFLESTGKEPIVIEKCIPGFVANRLTLALAREAYYLAGEGIVSTEDIDRVITSTFGPRYVFEGIFDLYDQIGIDVGYRVAKGLLPELCSDVTIPKLMEEKYSKGEYGVKTGKGFKDYSDRDVSDVVKERNEKVIRSFELLKNL